MPTRPVRGSWAAPRAADNATRSAPASEMESGALRRARCESRRRRQAPRGGAGGNRTRDLLDAIEMLYRLSYVPLAPCADPYRPPQGGHPCEAVPDLSARGDTASELSCAAARAASSPRAVSNRRPLPCRGSALPLSYTARPRRRRGEAPAPGIEPGTARLTVGCSAAELCRIRPRPEPRKMGRGHCGSTISPGSVTTSTSPDSSIRTV